MKRCWMIGCVLFPVSVALAMDVQLTWTFEDGKNEIKRIPLAETAYGYRLEIRRDAIPQNVKSLSILPEFARAKTGEDGYWVLANGNLGTFRETKGRVSLGAPFMPMFGMKTPRMTFVAIGTGMPYYFQNVVTAENGNYSLEAIYGKNLLRAYEDIAIEFHVLSGNEANYAGMARVYRRYQLNRKACVALRERAKSSPELRYAVEAPEVRVRHGWKPVPSPKPEQTPMDEPPMKPVITFDRLGDIVDEFRKQGVGKAEFCLVGWNIGGHDGRWPQIFPVEESLGGEAKLRAVIRKAQDAGYQIVAHGNHRDAYIIADNWDAEYIMKNADGSIPRTKTSWGGGRMYTICPKRAYERFATRDIFQVAGLGFRGLAYYDVFSCVPSPTCSDPRHPLNERESAFYISQMMKLAKEAMGGCASEGAYDHFVDNLDSVLYVSFANPFKLTNPMIDRQIPIWELVYHGIIVSNPFTTTVNFTAQDRDSFLKTIEFGARPNFYFYSKFKSDGKNWMGEGDLGCATDEELRASVAKVKVGWDIYEKLSFLQYEFMEAHDQLADHVFRTGYSNGAELITNYNDQPFVYRDRTIAAKDFLLLAR